MTRSIPPLLPETSLEGLKLIRRGKVRDVYEVDERHLLLVSTDRVSAFDFVLSPAIPYKGAVLNGISAWWFRKLRDRGARTHFLTDDLAEMPDAVGRHADLIRGRAALCRRARIVPFECVIRGYVAGSMVKEYAKEGLRAGDRLPAPRFTPTTKAEQGHDEPVTRGRMEEAIGAGLTEQLTSRTGAAYELAAAEARERGLILVDTKLEWGLDDAGELILCDEVFTPDSSRYWLAEEWRPGHQPEPLDKQVVRNYLLHESGWDPKAGGAPPPLPPHIAIETARRYLRLFEILTGGKL